MPENRRRWTRIMSDYKAIEWSEGKLKLLDQTRLPREYIVLDLESCQDAIDSIKEMRVRGRSRHRCRGRLRGRNGSQGHEGC